MQAASVCGFANFDWQQKINFLPAPSPFFQVGNPTPLTAPPAFNDPPPRGYTYEPNGDNSFPFYYDPNNGELLGQETANTLFFSDAPADPCLPGPLGIPSFAWLFNSQIRHLCNNSTAPRGSYLAFTTHLAGVNFDGSATDLGIGFSWKDNFNGTSGGIATTKNSVPVDPGSGTGGVTILSINQTTTLSGVSVTGVNGVASGSAPALASGSACNGVFSGTFNGDINVSAGQNCTFINGTVNGNVNITGGGLVLSGDLITGTVQINGGDSFFVGPFTTIQGDLEATGIPSSAQQSNVCQSLINGELHVHNNGAAVQIGTADISCGGNIVVGNVEIHNNTGLTTTFQNTVSGNLHDHNNTGPTQVFGNTVVKNLQCMGNSSITGGTNTAEQKQGQCINF